MDSLKNCFVWGRGGRGFVLGLGMRFGEVERGNGEEKCHHSVRNMMVVENF